MFIPLLATKEGLGILLALFLGFNALFLNPSDIDKINVTIEAHKVLDDGVEYQGILELEEKKEPFKGRVKPKNNELEIEFERKDLKIKYKKSGFVEDQDREMVNKIYDEIVRYNSRLTVKHQIIGQVTDFITKVKAKFKPGFN